MRINPSLLELKDANGRTALDLACFQGELSCVQSLLRYAEANCESHDSIDQRTPVHAAAYTNNIDCLRTIVSARYEMCAELANSRDRLMRTPLMYAVEQGHLNTVSFLIYYMGADVTLVDHKKRTALHRAVSITTGSFFVLFNYLLIFKTKLI